VYWLALDFLDAVQQVLQPVPVKGSLGDQLGRAAESILLNLREGAAHITPAKKVYHFQLSHGSADECIGALHAFARRYPRMHFNVEVRMANMICVMMIGLIRAQERGGK
jgi:four helix bundle protein